MAEESPGPSLRDIQGLSKETAAAPSAVKTRAINNVRTWVNGHEPITNERITVDNPFGVRVPRQYAEYAPLIAVESALIRDFSMFYTAQRERMIRDDTSVTLGPQAAFNQELRRFITITREVTDIAQSRQGSHARVRVFSDLDESAGSVIGRKEPIRLPGYPDLRYEDMTADQQAQHRELCVRSVYEDFAFSPGYVHALNYLHDTFDQNPGIDFGVISTKAQSGMLQYLMPTLDEVIPNAFRPHLILSSAPNEVGAAEFYIPEVAELTKDRWNSPSFGQAFAAFIEASPQEEQEGLRQIMAEYPKSELRKEITDFHIKLFIIIRLQQNEKAQIEKFYSQDISQLDHEVDMPPPETKDVLLDDARIPARLFPSVRVVKLDRWRLPDEKSKKRKKTVKEDTANSTDDPLDAFPDL
ncbi:MAG TPA: hypothetical protein VND99_01265 [Candidatus Acidoferrales bacterium]|nr:hypothetical protein [Candidatus Acidoferrales bacterium]